MLITRRSASKGIPTDDDMVVTSIGAEDDNALLASSAMEIHRAIYKRTDAGAVIHAHPSKTVSLSFFLDEITPLDENGLLYLGPRVSVVAAPTLFGWNLAAEDMAQRLVDGRVVVEKWHGTFAKGADLTEAFHRTRAVEFMSAHVIRVGELGQWLGKATFPPKEVAEVIGGVAGRGLRRIK
jgi:L-fuculose-phosphate aldolase